MSQKKFTPKNQAIPDERQEIADELFDSQAQLPPKDLVSLTRKLLDSYGLYEVGRADQLYNTFGDETPHLILQISEGKIERDGNAYDLKEQEAFRINGHYSRPAALGALIAVAEKLYGIPGAEFMRQVTGIPKPDFDENDLPEELTYSSGINNVGNFQLDGNERMLSLEGLVSDTEKTDITGSTPRIIERKPRTVVGGIPGTDDAHFYEHQMSQEQLND